MSPRETVWPQPFWRGFYKIPTRALRATCALKWLPIREGWEAFEKFGGLGAVAKPASDYLTEEIAGVQRRWLLVADIFQMIVDMAHDDRIALRRGPSISKAIELCEIERIMPGHSQLRKAWSDFRDVAHLIVAGAYLAHKGLAKAAAHEPSILNAIWIAPECRTIMRIFSGATPKY